MSVGESSLGTNSWKYCKHEWTCKTWIYDSLWDRNKLRTSEIIYKHLNIRPALSDLWFLANFFWTSSQDYSLTTPDPLIDRHWGGERWQFSLLNIRFPCKVAMVRTDMVWYINSRPSTHNTQLNKISFLQFLYTFCK